MRASFAEIDITPPIGTHKIGWLIDLVPETVLDPLHARAAIFDDGESRIGFIQLDTLTIRWTQVMDIRARIEAQTGFPGGHLMVSATHNHAGPAVSRTGAVERDEAYVEWLVGRCVECFATALAGMQEARLGFQHVYEFDVAKNRRVVMRDGTVRTHGCFLKDSNALCIEGPIDPEVAVLAAHGQDDALLGCLVNFACHPVHEGGGTAFSAGYPGVLAAAMRARGCGATLFLNGACGNTHTHSPATNVHMSMDDAGNRLADDAWRAIDTMTFSADWPLAAAQTTVELPYREITDEQVNGTARGAQRFIDPQLYDRNMPALIERIRTRGSQPVEVQVLSIGPVSVVGIPAEYFVEHGLRIKEASHPRHALIAAYTNGMVGYVPTRQAFARGGYETTFSEFSRQAPEAGDLLADAAIALIGDVPK